MTRKIFLSITTLVLLFSLFSCGKDVEIEPIVPKGFTLNSNEGKREGLNSVFLSLADKKTTFVDRESWDLAFYCGKDHNRVSLNNTREMMAIELKKNKIAEVNFEDTLNLREDFSLSFHGGNVSLLNFDSTDGAITKTVFAEISENPDENKVYFVVTDAIEKDKKKWYCVKVDRKADEYILQYVQLQDAQDADKVKTIKIAKDDSFNFVFVSLASGMTVEVEPQKDKWDIEYTVGVYKTNSIGHDKEKTTKEFRAYFMKDLVFINNLGKVTAAVVNTKDGLNYENITLEKAKLLTMENSKDAIADKWRDVFKGFHQNLFYIIKDVKGDYYKFKFLRSGIKGDGGLRGCPEVLFAKIETK